MSTRVEPTLKKDLAKFGVSSEWNECFHCGNCTAVCPLTEQGFLFPRKGIRSLQMGLKKKIAGNVAPWLCYYCGDCSETCPRDANPGELMMTLRRYLTSVYDWTGLSKKFYTSKGWEFGSIFFVAAVVIALFAIFLPPSPELFSNPAAFVNAQGGVMINNMVEGVSGTQFVTYIEWGDWIMAIFVGFLLITNIFNMFMKVIVKDKSTKVPFYAYFTELFSMLFHFVTQARFSKCEDRRSSNYWIFHLLLMTGYTIMFILVVVFLPEFQIEGVKPWYNWQRLLGYYATFGILLFIVIALIGRMRKGDIKFKFSHSTDYLFLVMLGLTTLTGIILHIFRLMGLPAATYIVYVLHLAILVPMIMIEVPFSKWAHLAYRPFGVYFQRLKKAGQRKQLK